MSNAKPFPNPINSFPFQITSIQNPRKYNVQQNINLGDQILPPFSVKSKLQITNSTSNLATSNIPSLNNSSLPQPPNNKRKNLSPRNTNYRVNSKVYSALTWQNETDGLALPSYTVKPLSQSNIDKIYSKQSSQMAQFHPSIVDGNFEMLKEDQRESGSFSGTPDTMSKESSSSDLAEEKIILAEDEILIHVFDETNKISRDFKCKKELLLREMKYFRTYFSDQDSSNDDIDISVHCDVNIFEWLMKYIHSQDEKPEITTAWAVSILISSDFLEMEELSTLALQFVHDKLQQIVRLPIELDCINNDLLSKLGDLFTVEELDAIKDKKDKILSRIYMKKFESMMESDQNSILRCTTCGKLYCKKQGSWMKCHKANIYIDFHGQAVAKHTPDSNFNVNKYLVKLKKELSWREIYWKFFGLTNSLYCLKCRQFFPLSEFSHCSYHPVEPIFEAGSNTGMHPCCKTKAMRFDSGLVEDKGCRAVDHKPKIDDEEDEYLLQTLTRCNREIIIPFESSQEHHVKESKRIKEALHVNIGSDERDSDEDSVMEFGTATGYDSDSDNEGKPSVPFTNTVTKYEIFNTFSRMTLDSNRNQDSSSSKEDAKIAMTPTRKRHFIMDNQRDDDRKNLNDIIKSLLKTRKDKPSTITFASTNSNATNTAGSTMKKSQSSSSVLQQRKMSSGSTAPNLSSKLRKKIFR